MATTNVQQWNPGAANQENDAAYLADSQRAGGATDPSLFLSPLANKVFYQMSTYLTALFTAFAAKGFTTSDSNLSTLTAQCANFLTSADFRANLQNVAYAPNVSFDVSQSLGFQLTLAGNSSITVSNVAPGDIVAFLFVQDSSGSRTVTFSGGVPVLWPSGALIDPTPNAITMVLFKGDVAGQLVQITPAMSSVNGIIGTPIGATQPSTGKFTTLTLAAPGSAGQVLTNVGGFFVPQSPGFSRVTNSNGSYRISPDGTIEVWGSISVPSTGNQFANASIVFPHGFTAVPGLQVTVQGLPSPSAHANDIASASAVSVTTTGAQVYLQCSVPTSGGGANFDQAVTLAFYAIGN